jgi:succinoglycan biosynthesis protein ExoA
VSEEPLVSVVMPVRNEAGFISKSLGAVLSQNYPKDKLEILVADGMSEDGTREIVLEKAREYPNIVLLENPSGHTPSALNSAIRKSRGSVIVRVDGHTIITENYVHECVDALKRSGADNAGGKMTAAGTNTTGEAVALATSHPFGVGGARFHYSHKEEWVDTVYLGAWRREIFDKIGFFDEEMLRNQDDEWNYRLIKNGGRILLSPRIRSLYTVRSSLNSLWKQYFDYGLWKVRVLQKHHHQMRVTQFVPPLFVLAIIMFLFAAAFFNLWGPLIVLTGAYIAANFFVSAGIAYSNGWEKLFMLPVVFAVLHLSYGSGFLAGMFKFRKFWGAK